MLRYLARAIRHPEPATGTNSLLRQVLLRPRLFDLVSCALQLRDYRRLVRVAERLPDDSYYTEVKRYNAGVTLRKLVTRTRRTELMYQLLTTAGRDVARDRLLIVGPRNVHEVLIAWLYGFRWRNIRGVDLYATNGRILVMNMEEMGFRDGAFDAVAMGQTLAYARDPFQCLSEIARVLKPGGRLAFTSSYWPDGDYAGNKIPGSHIAQMLKRLSLRVVFYEPRDKINSVGGLQTVHAFLVEKADAAVRAFDRAEW